MAHAMNYRRTGPRRNITVSFVTQREIDGTWSSFLESVPGTLGT